LSFGGGRRTSALRYRHTPLFCALRPIPSYRICCRARKIALSSGFPRGWPVPSSAPRFVQRNARESVTAGLAAGEFGLVNVSRDYLGRARRMKRAKEPEFLGNYHPGRPISPSRFLTRTSAYQVKKVRPGTAPQKDKSVSHTYSQKGGIRPEQRGTMKLVDRSCKAPRQLEPWRRGESQPNPRP
jgi:hypothetical protein